jgi:tripartite-type tricarboxylate transporter receptor subunit TctC
MATLPNVPTIDEQGLAGYEAASWYGILAPAGTPQPVIDRLNSEINKALQTADVREKLTSEGATPVGGSPKEFGDHIRAELKRMGQYAKSISLE